MMDQKGSGHTICWTERGETGFLEGLLNKDHQRTREANVISNILAWAMTAEVTIKEMKNVGQSG